MVTDALQAAPRRQAACATAAGEVLLVWRRDTSEDCGRVRERNPSDAANELVGPPLLQPDSAASGPGTSPLARDHSPSLASGLPAGRPWGTANEVSSLASRGTLCAQRVTSGRRGRRGPS